MNSNSEESKLSNGFGTIDPTISWGNIIEILSIIVISVIFITTTRAKLNNVEDRQRSHIDATRTFHNNTIPDVYVRKDVIVPQLELMREDIGQIKLFMQNYLRDND